MVSLRYLILFSVQALAVLVSDLQCAFWLLFLAGGDCDAGMAAACAFHFFFRVKGQLPVTNVSEVAATWSVH